MISSQKLHEHRRGFRYLTKDHFGWPRKTLLGRKRAFRFRELLMWLVVAIIAAGVLSAALVDEPKPAIVRTAGSR